MNSYIPDLGCVNIRRQIQFERHRFTIVTYARMIVHAHVNTINFARAMMRYDGGSWPWRRAHRVTWIIIIPTACWLAYNKWLDPQRPVVVTFIVIGIQAPERHVFALLLFFVLKNFLGNRKKIKLQKN